MTRPTFSPPFPHPGVLAGALSMSITRDLWWAQVPLSPAGRKRSEALKLMRRNEQVLHHYTATDCNTTRLHYRYIITLYYNSYYTYCSVNITHIIIRVFTSPRAGVVRSDAWARCRHYTTKRHCYTILFTMIRYHYIIKKRLTIRRAPAQGPHGARAHTHGSR
jgi:hypothetical protein